jgi:hypothetical protein
MVDEVVLKQVFLNVYCGLEVTVSISGEDIEFFN